MKFRHHRGSLAESMRTVVELDPSLEALRAHLTSSRKNDPHGNHVGNLVVSYYGEDNRIGWSITYIVTEDGNAIGFTNGPINVENSREIKDDQELFHFVQSIIDIDVTPIKSPNAGVQNSKELLQVKASARRIKSYLDYHLKEIELEFNAVARTVAARLPIRYDWQHIREASKAFVKRLEALSLNKVEVPIDPSLLTADGIASVLTDVALVSVKMGQAAERADREAKELTRQEMFDLVLKAIKTQPFEMVFRDGETPFTSSVEGDLGSFVSNTWVAAEADELFEHVTNRVLDALENAKQK